MKRLLLAALVLCCASVCAQTINPNQIRPSATSGQVLTTVGGQTTWQPATGGGSVTAVTVTPANGVSATVANQGTTPALTFTLGGITPSSAAIGGTTSVQSLTPATGSLNQNSPNFTIGGNCWNGTASVSCGALFSLTPGATGANPGLILNINSSGSSGLFEVLTPFIVTNALNVVGLGQFFTAETIATAKATSTANFAAGIFQLQGAIWNGTVSTPDSWSFVQTVGTGTNPTSTLTLNHSGSTGATNLVLPNVNLNINKIVNGIGLQVATASTASCTTSLTAFTSGSTCTVHVTLPVSEPDTNFNAVCTVSGDFLFVADAAPSSTTTISADLYASATGVHTNGQVNCMVIHN